VGTTSRDGLGWVRRRRTTTALAALALIHAPARAGCGDSSDGATADPPASSGAPAGSSASPSASAAPATGKAVETSWFGARAPQGWQVVETVPDFATYARKPGSDSFISFGAIETYGNTFTLAQLAHHSLRSNSWAKRPSILAETTLAGEPAYHLRGPVGGGLFADVYGALYQGRQVELDIETEGSAAEHREVVDSVLASWQWK